MKMKIKMAWLTFRGYNTRFSSKGGFINAIQVVDAKIHSDRCAAWMAFSVWVLRFILFLVVDNCTLWCLFQEDHVSYINHCTVWPWKPL